MNGMENECTIFRVFKTLRSILSTSHRSDILHLSMLQEANIKQIRKKCKNVPLLEGNLEREVTHLYRLRLADDVLGLWSLVNRARRMLMKKMKFI